MERKISRIVSIVFVVSLLWSISACAVDKPVEIKKIEYDYVFSSQNGIREVSEDGKRGCIDEEGNVLITPGDETYIGLANGLILINDKGKRSAIDAKGEIVTVFDQKVSDEYITYFNGECGFALKESVGYKYALTDKYGKPITPFIYDDLWMVDSSECPDSIGAVLEDKIGYLKLDGSVRRPFDYRSNFYGFCEGFSVLLGEDNEHFAFLNQKGEIVTNFIYDAARPFHEGVAAVCLNGKWGYIDTNMQQTIPFIYEEVSDFQHGYAKVQEKDVVMSIENPTMKMRDINVYLDGLWLYTDQEPVIKSERTLAPFRGIAEALGYSVEWNDQMKLVTLQNAEKIIHLTIGSRKASVNVFDDGIPAETITLDVAPQIIEGRTFVPVRFVAETIGADVSWNQEDKTILITTN